MKDMLYYPGFETRNESWLKFALLYFDTLRPIVPHTIYPERTYLSNTFRRVMDETDLINLYRPEYEDGFCASILACEEFEKYLRDPALYSTYFGYTKFTNYTDKWKNRAYQDCTLFEGKYSGAFFDFCIKNDIATSCDEGIHISSDLAFVYMSLLADVISKKHEYEMITDVKKYSQFLINKDLYISKTVRSKIKIFKNQIELAIPSNIGSVSIEQIIELRKRPDFREARKAYIKEIDELILHQETYANYSLKNILSYKKEFVSICEHAINLTASAVVSAYSFYALADGVHGQETIPVLASAVVDFNTVKSSFHEIPGYIEAIKTKHLARRYIANIRQLNEPVRKRLW